eukprot:CAMPEP_0202713102 /NCGR_PEP_ID=MMETSP1385-20130828/49804_1 /ASSEMBLY_ACC=CAM_ASM_000861 /TAXON_ID=933848 /ORGANISM="Elphidium margaritaceum" /LENGTH=325 /DNA_ID=CAMNT_0049373349 /DNA_START=47 /DNA_END=1024 /DNA_ORIENTATION=+
MKAVVCTKFGEPKEVLQIQNLPIPEVQKPNQAVVKVLYASLNPVDWKIAKGYIPKAKQTPYTICADYAGRVVAKGNDDKLKDIAVGDLVYGQAWSTGGSFAEYVLVSDVEVDKMPANVSASEAAAIPLVSNTSYQLLQDKLKVKKGEKVLILGGSTATGMAATQIAKRLLEAGEVVVTSSQEELCKSLGADRVINYRNEKWEEVLKNADFDVVFDTAQGQSAYDAVQASNVLKKDGRYASIVGGPEFVMQNPLGPNLKDVSKLVSDGKLKLKLDQESPFKFEDFLKMFEKSMAGKARGKLVMQVSEDEQGGAKGTKDVDDEKDVK